MPINYISKINVNSVDYEIQSANGAPAGGSAGQVLAKVSGADFDFAWSNAGGGGGGGGYVPLSTAIVTLVSSDWDSSTPEGYMQTVTVTGMTSTANVWVSPAYSVTYNYAEMYATDQIVCTAQGTDSLTFRRYASSSSGDIVLNIVWTEDSSDQLIPSGGTTGQVLAKASGTDYDVTWVNPSGGTSPINVFSATILTSGETATITLGNSKTAADLNGSKPSALYIKNYDSGGSAVDFNMLVLLNVDDVTASTMRIDGVAYANSKRLRIYGTYNNSATALNAYWENIPVPPKQEQIVLISSDWVTGSGGGFLAQSVSLSGITASSVVWVSPEPYGNNVEDFANAKIYCSGQGSGTLTFNTIGTPTITEDIDVIVVWM